MFQILTLVFYFTFLTLVHTAPLERRGIDQGLFDKFALIEQYAAAAYCPGNHNAAANSLITCAKGNCPQVQSSGATAVVEFQNLGKTDGTGFVAVDNTNKMIVVAFRGSKSVSNYLADFDIELDPWGCCNGCKLHSGFLDSWNQAKSTVTDAVKSAIQQFPNYAVVVTGHSLGAAIATIGAAELRTQGISAALYTYGSPMVGNLAAVQFITKQAGGNFRITHASDAIPKLPGYLLQYAHVSPEYWIKTGDNVMPSANDLSMSSGSITFSGNGGTFGISLSNHLWYFNAISSCDPNRLELSKRDDETLANYTGNP